MTMRHLTMTKRALAGSIALLGLTTIMLAVPKMARATVPPPSPAQRLQYQDSDGPGTLEITHLGPDAATGGVLIQVRLTQGGYSYTGAGFRLRTFTPPPGSYDMQTIDLVVFTLKDAYGRAFTFRGQIREGGIFYHIEGSGRYGYAGSATDLADWQVRDF
jgi:hypothetical protein